MKIKSSKSPQFSNPKADPELEQYYQWSDHPTSLQYDRIGDRFVNVGSFPFYQETPSLPICQLPYRPESGKPEIIKPDRVESERVEPDQENL